MNLPLGKKAPDFSLPDQNGKQQKLSDYRGKWVLLYFYPRDNTPGCTKEACGIRDSFPEFNQLEITVLGISTDSEASHAKFAQKYRLPFSLLADKDKKIVKLYGVWGKKKFLGKEFMGTKRTSFLINPNGKIVKIYEQVKPDIHAQEVLEDLAKLK
ncbi:MAG: thioredoxin-dependent thiol peroxidase [Candidatus Kerfeldbacteria bacterium CG_4_10_14_0_8_um_filter_42_10]|uniref:thioredoxin-dependent peroxiredoxin n=1 Tax=Candidatus Kerfeldbacteria bacterium CG_4_10_14_0_8_um_filter_42_10 TaxID=2014248 RepID=A0A2M7RGS5_9BACT|nr:MAG: thioredoxin-dependent thiol peroxidase [Candidatus Kerfeldbacteria bacterium CG_4_10_14_0_8_um_filter_42_10]